MIKEIVKLLPYSLTQDPVLVAMFEAAAIQLHEAYQEAEAVYDLVDVDKIPEVLLDLIAYERHVDFYDNELSLNQKRELVKKSKSWHRKKGTRWAIESVVSVVYPNAEVFEWFEYGGDPYKFKVEVDEPFIVSKDMKRLKDMIESTKNSRSWLEYIAIRVLSELLTIKNKEYTFEAPYPICNMFRTDTVPGKLGRGTFALQHDSYVFDAFTPICGTFLTSTINSVESHLNVELSNEYRNVDVLYKRAGEQTITGEGEI